MYDLENGIIRTPIDPFKTFLDDPLRILRVIRFTTRFQFALADEIPKSVKNYEIKKALKKKVSNERIHKELELMFEGNKPQSAVYLIYKFEILDNILKVPLHDKLEELKDPAVVNRECVRVVNMIAVASVLIDKYLRGKLNSLNFFFLNRDTFEDNFLAKFTKALFFDILAFPFRKFKVQIKKNMVSGAELIISESLKMSKDSIKEIETILMYYSDLRNIIHKGIYTRLEVGLLLRNITVKNLTQMLIISISEDYLSVLEENSKNNSLEVIEEVDTKLIEDILKKYIAFVSFIITENLKDIENMKTLLRGDEIQNIAKVKGSDTKKYVDFVLHQQIMNPLLTGADMKKLLEENKHLIK